ncbi:vacuolar membrane protein [[Candida] jaroonii]|uniref:Vacuolar membrane protein n=1 Tax=[Candida] jaroonii TaxID=467808 RepID=A0ACA9Y458_9ASCO|nr:vacuolar membrane protein [[Candida] jaroonii]
MITLKDDDNKCELIGTFSLLTQASLGLLCLSSLIVKRYYEWPNRRTWKIWFFDVSKQLFGAFGVHIVNVMLSILKTKKDPSTTIDGDSDDGSGGWETDDDDPCNWYFLNIVFDCTVGVYILYWVFKGCNHICKNYFHMTKIKSGEYGDPPSLVAYFKQLSIYFTSLMITKVILFFAMNIFSLQLVWITSHILLGWLDDYPDELEIFIVIFVVPIFMNCLQLILVDNIIKNPYFTRTIIEPAPEDLENPNKIYGSIEDS